MPIFVEEFGVEPDQLFEYFEHEAIASASIAQVHRAKLRNGEWVAVKVQKPYIRSQMTWDLACYGILAWCFEKIFDLPVYWTVGYTQDNISKFAIHDTSSNPLLPSSLEVVVTTVLLSLSIYFSFSPVL